MAHQDTKKPRTQGKLAPDESPLGFVMRQVLSGHPAVAWVNVPKQRDDMLGKPVVYGVFAWTRLPTGNPALHVIDWVERERVDTFWQLPPNFSRVNEERFRRDVDRFAREYDKGADGKVLKCFRLLDADAARRGLEVFINGDARTTH